MVMSAAPETRRFVALIVPLRAAKGKLDAATPTPFRARAIR